MTVGRRIALKRTEKGITQTDLAKAIGVKPASVSQYETDDRNPSYEKLRKIANALDTTIDFLLVGEEKGDSISKKINLALASFTVDEKKEIFAVMQRMAGITDQLFNLPESQIMSPGSYAEHLIKKLGFHSLPIDPFMITEKLIVKIIYSKDALETDGELIKGPGQPIIILDSNQHPSRQRFTLAMLIGHLVMPWHLRPRFNREKGKTSSNVEDPLGIEARQFAKDLMAPKYLILPELEKLIKNKLCILQSLEELAAKYKTSLIMLAIRLVECFPQDFVVLGTKEENVVRKYADNKLIPVEKLLPNSVAYNMLLNPPNQKTFINGSVQESIWFSNGDSNKTILEEVVYNPQEIGGPPQFLVLLRIKP